MVSKSPLSFLQVNAKIARFLFLLAALICGSLLTAVLLTTLNPVRPALAAAGPLCYVNAAANGANSGDSWTDAYSDLQAALMDANCPEIWVATGVYTPGIGISESFVLTAGVQLYGGFAATETLRSQRNFTANPTILSGDIGGDDLTDANGVVTTTGNLNGTNSYHVVWADGVTQPITESTVLDGFTITAGQANDSSWPDDSGGGFFCDGEGSGSECSPTLSNVVFSGNLADYDGGGMFNFGALDGSSSPTLSNVTFTGNSAGYDGGGMCNVGWVGVSSPVLTAVTFFGNTAGNDGAAMINFGDVDGVSSPSLINVTFLGNVADDDGGAMYNIGFDTGISSPNLENVIFSGNTANDSGGAMYNHGDMGGTSMSTLNNVVFSGNFAADKGGAMSNYVNDGGVSMPTLVNVTLSGNSATFGGAIASYSDNGGTNTPSLTNVIIWGNTAVMGTELYNFTATPSISYSLIQSDTTNAIFNSISSSIIYGPNILTSDPRFVDDVGPDGIVGTLDDDLRLANNSPAIDAGDNDAVSQITDLDGSARFYDDTAVADTGNGAAPIVDMGAYEKQSDSWTILYLPIVAKDG